MKALSDFRKYLLAFSLIVVLQPLQGTSIQESTTQRDGQHDFDFEIGNWKTHLSRLQHPLSGSHTWIEYEGTSVVRKVWDGRANLVELEVDGPGGHVEGLSLRLYNPQSHQWSLNFANANGGTSECANGGRIQEWARRVLRSGTDQWPNHSGAQCVDGHDGEFMPLRAVVFR